MDPGPQTSEPARTESARVAQLDQAIWARLRNGESRDGFIDAWLTLQCRIVGGVRSATAVARGSGSGRFVPAAVWPAGAQDYPELSDVTETALNERRGVLLPARDGDRDVQIAYPFIFDDEVHGAVSLRLENRDDRQLRFVMRQLQWGVAWIELMLRRETTARLTSENDRIAGALEMIAAALEGGDFKASAMALATELATRLDCERVAIAWLDRGKPDVVALSHSADVAPRMNLVRALEAAMGEAIDQEAPILRRASGAEESDPVVSEAHARLLREHGGLAVLSLPLYADDEIVGALSLEHREIDGFDQARVELIESIASVTAPVLREKHANDRPLAAKAVDAGREQLTRLFGPGYPGRKIFVAILTILVLFFALYRTDYRVTADLVLEGQVQRVVAAPFDGYLVDEAVRPGDLVEAGAVLARLDDRDLLLERISAMAELRQREVERDAALARAERAQTRILEAQINQIQARIGLIDAQLVRTRVVAPLDGVVVSGDNSQNIGAAITRGQELYVIAPLSEFRVVLNVDERDIDTVRRGQPGTIRFATFPDRAVTFEVTKITPVAEARDGANTFRVEAAIDSQLLPGIRTQLLPGMEGVGKIEAGPRRLIWIWTHRATEWLRLALWSWLP